MWISVTPALNESRAANVRSRLPGRQSWSKWSGKTTACLGGEAPEREAGALLGDRRRQADRQGEVDGELEVDVEELGPQRDRREVRREVGDVDAPGQGPLDLGAQLAADLVGVGVLPEVVDGRRESTVTGEQRWGVGQRTPAVASVLGVEREVDADVVDRRYCSAAWRAHGAGTISDVHVAEPSRIAW